MSDLYFGGDFSLELDRMQRQVSSLFGNLPSSLRSSRGDAFPRLNIGSTDDAIRYRRVPARRRARSLEVTVDKGTLTISGERRALASERRGRDADVMRKTLYGQLPTRHRTAAKRGRGQGRSAVRTARLSITVGKREASKPLAITIQ